LQQFAFIKQEMIRPGPITRTAMMFLKSQFSIQNAPLLHKISLQHVNLLENFWDIQQATKQGIKSFYCIEMLFFILLFNSFDYFIINDSFYTDPLTLVSVSRISQPQRWALQDSGNLWSIFHYFLQMQF
jgi:hypothetical protein